LVAQRLFDCAVKSHTQGQIAIELTRNPHRLRHALYFLTRSSCTLVFSKTFFQRGTTVSCARWLRVFVRGYFLPMFAPTQALLSTEATAIHSFHVGVKCTPQTHESARSVTELKLALINIINQNFLTPLLVWVASDPLC
jgi:hypothetical protein